MNNKKKKEVISDLPQREWQVVFYSKSYSKVKDFC